MPLLRSATTALLFALVVNLSARAANLDCVQVLAACPDKPNCMSTNDPSPDHRFPELKLTGDPDAAWAAVRKAVLAFERVTVLADKPGYLHVSIKSAVFEFIDDLEVTQCNGAEGDNRDHTLSVRSASRTGYWDIGVNSGRIETLVQRLRETGVAR